MDFNIPQDIADYLVVLDDFIEEKIKPLEQKDDNIRFFDHRREWARTDFDNDGLPRPEWEDLLRQAKKLADEAGHLRYAWPKEFGGQDGTNLGMAIIREHFARKGLGLHNGLQNEHSIVGNFPQILMLRDFARPDQKHLAEDALNGKFLACFGLTEPDHGSDATHMETRAVRQKRDGKDGWLINGEKMWITGMHVATHCAMFARTSGEDGAATGITCFLVPNPTEGLQIEEWMWTFNMPTDHPRLSIKGVWVPDSAILGREGRGHLELGLQPAYLLAQEAGRDPQDGVGGHAGTIASTMLILLPPSEGKTAPRRGKPLDLAALTCPELTDARRAVIDALGVTTAIYVGDTEVDEATARAAGVPFRGVGWAAPGRLSVPKAERLSRLSDLAV